MNITFTPLKKEHFPLLLKWLETPHVKAWWDSDVKWTPELVEQTYRNYVIGYIWYNKQLRAISAYIICIENVPIGYVQIYNFYDYNNSEPLERLPHKIAGIDLFIGEADYLKGGVGSTVIKEFLDTYAKDYTHTFADPDSKNIAAIKAYKKAGFKKIKEFDTGEIWMLRENPSVLQVRLERYQSEAMCRLFSKYFLERDELWLFGSRTNLLRRGGDIDLYIETSITDSSTAYDKKSAFTSDLKREIGERKIDVVLRLRSSDKYLLIYDVAKEEGVRLV